MFIKKKVWKSVCAAVLLAVAVYTVICCMATLCQAIQQPYLASDTAEYHFLGYYIMSAVYGTVCVLCISAVTAILLRRRKNPYCT